MDIKIVEWFTFSHQTRRAGDLKSVVAAGIRDHDDPSNMLNLLVSTSGNNDGVFQLEVDKLLEEANALLLIRQNTMRSFRCCREPAIMEDAAVSPLVYSSDFICELKQREHGILHMVGFGTSCTQPWKSNWK